MASRLTQDQAEAIKTALVNRGHHNSQMQFAIDAYSKGAYGQVLLGNEAVLKDFLGDMNYFGITNQTAQDSGVLVKQEERYYLNLDRLREYDQQPKVSAISTSR